MIVDLPGTTTSAVSKTLVRIREEGGAVALGRVLTLVIVTGLGDEEEAISAANDASREHPMRVIVLSIDEQRRRPRTRVEPRLDAQIRVGGDAGASEVVVLRAHGEAAQDQESLVTGLLLPDAPVVAWWPGDAPERVSDSQIGRMATRRITDAADDLDPQETLRARGRTYAPGDTDFAWTRLTLWRAQLAAVLDQPPYQKVTRAQVRGSSASPSTMLLAAWLELQLKVAVELVLLPGSNTGIQGVQLHRKSGVIQLERTAATVARLVQPGQPTHDIALPRRNLRDCLAEELRRLGPDDLYGEVIRKGVPRVDVRTREAVDESRIRA